MEVVVEFGYYCNENVCSICFGYFSGLIGVVIMNIVNLYYSIFVFGVEEEVVLIGCCILFGNIFEDVVCEVDFVGDFFGCCVDGLIVVFVGMIFVYFVYF